MSNRMMEVITTVIELVMRLLVAVCVSNFVLNGLMAYEEFQAVNTLYIMVPVTAFFFARRFLYNHGKIMVGLHLLFLLSVIPAVNTSIEDTAIVFIITFVFMAASVKSKGQAPFVPADVGIILVGFILSGTLKSNSAAVIPAYSAVIYVICYFIYINLKNVREFLNENAQVKSFKADQALNVNAVMMAVFMIVCIIAMFIAPRLHIQDILAVIGRGIGAGIIWLLKRIDAPVGGYELEFENVSKPKPVEEAEPGGLVLGMGEGSVILDTIAAVIGIVILLACIVLLVRAVKQIRFERVCGSDVKEFIHPEFTDVKTAKSAGKRAFEFKGSNNELFRKKYKRFILKNKEKRKIISSSDLPCDITKMAGGSDEITRIYEKARYSNEIITDEEMKVNF